MEISKNSWHYKLVEYIGESFESGRYFMPTTLCSYFWTLVLFTPLKILTTLGILIAVIFFMTMPIWSIVGMVYLDDEIFTGTATVSWILVSVVVLANLIEYFRYNSDFKFKIIEIVVEYIKAKKRKVCPFIEYTDE